MFEALQNHHIPLNLISTGARTHLIPRNIDHEWVDEFPDAVLAGMELSGKAITERRELLSNRRLANHPNCFAEVYPHRRRALAHPVTMHKLARILEGGTAIRRAS